MNVCAQKRLCRFKPVYRAYPHYLESNFKRCQLVFLSPSTLQAAVVGALLPVWNLRGLIWLRDQPLQLMS